MAAKIEIKPVGTLDCRIQPPGSKSITNRALICAALASGNSVLAGVLESEDTQVMIDGLRELGIDLHVDWRSHTIEVAGCGGLIPATEADLFVGNSGTTVRFLTSMVALGKGRYRLDGVQRMRERPIADLLDALREIGVDARSERDTGCPPVVVNANGLGPGWIKQLKGNISSQFLSGLLMAAGSSRTDILIDIEGELVSKPYVEMTLKVMNSFGCEIACDGLAVFRNLGGSGYRGTNYVVEPDASAASYFWAAAAIAGGSVSVTGLSKNALQGDIRFCECLRQMGCIIDYKDDSITVRGGELHGIDVDMNDISDTVQTLSAVALFAKGTTRVRGVAHNRHKETDRIADLARELRKLGATVNEHADGLEIQPGNLNACEVETYDDHRMAMSMALVGLRHPGIVITNPDCTRKTYPAFFRDLSSLA